MRSVLSAIVILSVCNEFSYAIISLFKLPNGIALKKEHIVNNFSLICLEDINRGIVSLEQYHAAMQIRSCKYLYLLTEYNYLTILTENPPPAITIVRQAMEMIIVFMKKLNIPVSQLEPELSKFIEHSSFQHTKFRSTSNVFVIEQLLREFKEVLKSYIISIYTEPLNKVIRDVNDSIREEHEWARKERDLIREGYGLVHEGSGSVHEVYDPIRKGSGSIREGSGSFREGYDPIRKGSGLVREGSGSVREGYDPIRKGSGLVREGSSSVREGYDPIREEYGSVREGSGSVREGSGPVREIYDPVRDGYDPYHQIYTMDLDCDVWNEKISDPNFFLPQLETIKEQMEKKCAIQKTITDDIENYSFFKSIVATNFKKNFPPSYNFDKHSNNNNLHAIQMVALNIEKEYRSCTQ